MSGNNWGKKYFWLGIFTSLCLSDLAVSFRGLVTMLHKQLASWNLGWESDNTHLIDSLVSNPAENWVTPTRVTLGALCAVPQQIIQPQQVLSDSRTHTHTCNRNNWDPRRSFFSPLPLPSPTHFRKEQEDSDQGDSHEDKPHFPWHPPRWTLTNSKTRIRAPPSSPFQSLCGSFQASCLPPSTLPLSSWARRI